MTAEGTEAGAVYENPLIPNARLRQMYRAMVAMRALGRTLPPSKREGLGMEACLASTSVDLGAGDLVSDAFEGGVVDFLRGATLAEALRPGKAKRGLKAECGAAVRLALPAGIAERLGAALGAAAALRALAAQANAESKAAGDLPKDGRVAVVYVRPGEVSAALWRKVLPFALKEELPVLFVVLPPAKGSPERPGGVTPLALRLGVPGIPVDADDAVAIYRVAQESIGRARIGGGVALIECVPFVIAGQRSGRADGIAGLERYLLERKVATKAWIEGQTRQLASRMAKEKAASK